MDQLSIDEWDELKEWYSLHVRSGLPAQIARSANALNLSPSEFVEQAVAHELEEMQGTNRRAILRRMQFGTDARPAIRV